MEHIPTTNDVVEARHLIFLCHRLDASRHLLANLLAISNYIRLSNFTDCFGGEGLALDPNNGLQAIPKPFLPSLGTLH